MNLKWKRRGTFTLIEVLVVIAILAATTVTGVSKIGDVFDKPRDLEVQRDFKLYQDAAIVLHPTGKDFTVDNLNKTLPDQLKVSGTESYKENPFGKKYKIFVVDKDMVKIYSEKISKTGEINYEELIIKRENKRIKFDQVAGTGEVVNPILNVLDFYTFTNVSGEYKVALSLEFKTALDNKMPYKNWKTGTPLPNPGSEHNGLPVVDMSSMFANCKAITLDLSKFDTSNVISMEWMFYRSSATSLNLSSFNTSNVISMSNMFNTSKATTLDLSNFDTSKVTNMLGMFYNSAATSLNLSSFNTSNVTNMHSMFNASSATTLDLGNFDTSNVIRMSSMFNASKAITLDLSNFDTSNVTNMAGMFQESMAKSVNLSSFDTSKVTSMMDMFNNSKAIELDVKSFDTTAVTDMGGMFRGVILGELDLSFLDTTNVTSMGSKSAYYEEYGGSSTGYGMFQGSKINNLILGGKFTSSNVSNMRNMFEGATIENINQVLQYLDTSNVKFMTGMFSGNRATALDLSTFNTSKVINMNAMFAYSKAGILDLSFFDMSSVTNTELMFRGAISTTGYARTESDRVKLNTSSNKPAGLVFSVK